MILPRWSINSENDHNKHKKLVQQTKKWKKISRNLRNFLLFAIFNCVKKRSVLTFPYPAVRMVSPSMSSNEKEK